MVIWKVECEWDLGLNDVVWTDRAKLLMDVEHELKSQHLIPMEGSFADLMDNGYVRVYRVEVR